MNALRYNLIMYDKDNLIRFLEAIKLSRGKNISSCLYAYILHDKDVIEETGELKKEHYHLWLEFPSPVKDRDLIHLLELSGSNASALSHQKTDRNFLAYLTHNTINSALKKQYDYNDIITNIDKELFYEWYFEAVSKANKPTRQQQRIKESGELFTRLNKIIIGNPNITSFYQLLNALSENQEYDLIDFAMKKSYFIANGFKEAFQSNLEIKYKHDLTDLEEIDYEDANC